MSVTHTGVREAYRLQTDDGHTYVDVRSVPEYERGHPEGAHNVPLLHFDPATGQMRPNPDFLAVMQANFPSDAKLLIGCQVGGRSGKAALILADAGYAPVNVKGGFGGRRIPLQARSSTKAGPRRGCRWRSVPRRMGATRACSRRWQAANARRC